MQQREVEAKILDINKDLIIKKLLDVGFVKDYEKHLKAQWFENPLNSECVRVRLEENDSASKVVVEHKEFIKTEDNSKMAIETGFIADSFDGVCAVFKKLGFQYHMRQTEKTRQSFVLWDVRVDIDEYSEFQDVYVPTLLEIEAPDYDSILNIAKSLWYCESDLKDWGSGELYEFYKNN